MPKLDGLEVCRRLRTAGDRTPVLMLTARDAIDDRVEGLDVGADDYLVKPFALRELQARLRALLRRSGDGAGEGESSATPTSASTRSLTRCAAATALIELSKTEFLLLELFLRHPAPGAHALDDLRERLGLRLRSHVQRARRVHGLPAPQDRRGRRIRVCCTRSVASATSSRTEPRAAWRSVDVYRSSPPRRSAWRSLAAVAVCYVGRPRATARPGGRLAAGSGHPAIQHGGCRALDASSPGIPGQRRRTGPVRRGRWRPTASTEHQHRATSRCRSTAATAAIAATGAAAALTDDAVVGNGHLRRAARSRRRSNGSRSRLRSSSPARSTASTACSRTCA